MESSASRSTYLAVTREGPVAPVLRLLLELGVRLVGADEGSLLVLDRDAESLVFSMTAGTSEQVLLGQRVPLGQGITGLAAATGEVQIGAPTYFAIQQAESRAETSGPQAVLAAPMVVHGESLGVLTAVSFSPGKRFSSEDGQTFGQLATIAATLFQQSLSLGAIEAGLDLDGDGDLTLERQVAASVGRIARSGPQALRHLAAILQSVEALCASASS